MNSSPQGYLYWLPAPAQDFRAQCRQLTEGCSDLGLKLRVLSTAALGINQLDQLSRVLRRLREEGADLAPLVPFRLAVVSNSTMSLIVPALEASAPRHGIALEVYEAPFDQAAQQILGSDTELHRFRPDAVLLALDFDGVGLRRLPASAMASQGNHVIEGAMGYLQSLMGGVAEGCAAPCLVQTIPSQSGSAFGHFDRRVRGSDRFLVDEFNRRVIESLEGTSHVLFDVAHLAQIVGLEEWHDPGQRHHAKLPFAPHLAPLHADHVCRIIAAMRGKSRRCLVLDLDNTLWGGVIGDDGIEGIQLGPGNAAGEAHSEIQDHALALRERGIVLAVCSKNEDDVARGPFREHPEMSIREEHIAVFQANWIDKASNLRAISQALNLGLDALVLLDDNPAERAQVREALPEVAVPEVPDDPSLFVRSLLAAGYFETVSFSREDRERAEYYQANAQRAAVQGQVGDLGAYLDSLEMELSIAPFDAVGRERIAQLISKSNQFNLTTRRHAEAQIARFEESEEFATYQIRLRDRFGDNGMISVVICACRADVWEIDTWLMSCRVLGRRVEEAVLVELASDARAAGARTLRGVFVPSGRNRIVEKHYLELGFSQTHDDGESTHWQIDVDDVAAGDLPMKVLRP